MAENGSTLHGSGATAAFESKGKGKAAAEEPVDTAMEQDEDEDEDEDEVEDVGVFALPSCPIDSSPLSIFTKTAMANIASQHTGCR
jgi:hypothetical protein